MVGTFCHGLSGSICSLWSRLRKSSLALFESLHGKAPDIVGTGKFNPIPLLNAAVMMLRHLNEEQPAKRIEAAIEAALLKGVRTQDLGGVNSGHEMTQEIVRTLKSA